MQHEPAPHSRVSTIPARAAGVQLESAPPDRNHVALGITFRSSSLFGLRQWRPIPAFPGYEVSNMGDVRSLSRTILRAGRPVRLAGRQLIPRLLKVGYLAVSLSGATRYVHHLVCDTFHGPCPPGMERRHLNGNRTCNWAANLAHGTKSQNELDKRRHGRAIAGERCGSARLRMVEVVWARREAARGRTIASIAAALGRPVTTVQDAVSGESWKCCSEPPVRDVERRRKAVAADEADVRGVAATI